MLIRSERTNVTVAPRGRREGPHERIQRQKHLQVTHAVSRRLGLARSLMLKVLAKLQVGSLTLEEQGETLVFGSKTDPCTHAEVHVHDTASIDAF